MQAHCADISAPSSVRTAGLNWRKDWLAGRPQAGSNTTGWIEPGAAS